MTNNFLLKEIKDTNIKKIFTKDCLSFIAELDSLFEKKRKYISKEPRVDEQRRIVIKQKQKSKKNYL